MSASDPVRDDDHDQGANPRHMARSGAARSVVTRADVVRADTVRLDAIRPVMVTAGEAQAEAVKVESPRPDAAWADAARPKRVLACVIDDLGTGGAQRIVSVMARNLACRGIRIIVISLGTRDDEREALESSGIEVHVLPGRRLLSPGRIVNLIRLFRQIKPDIVHTHLLAAHVIAGPCARLLRIPVVSTLHNVDPHPRFAGTWKRVAESLCLRLAATRVIAVGPVVARTNSARLRGRAIDVLANPLSLTPATQSRGEQRVVARARVAEAVGATDSTVLFLTVGRLASEKGWPEFLDVFDALRKRHPDCKLVSVGDGPLDGAIRDAIDARGLGDHVHLLGRRDDVDTFCLGCDVFVLNSYIEGLPMALLEAMARGLPVVSTNVGDIEHAVGVDGALLVDSELPEDDRREAMVTALATVIERFDEAQERALRGLQRVHETFDVDAWTDQLVDLYRQSVPGWDEPLRVVEFIDGIKTGGAQALLALRARHAQRMGYRMRVVSLDGRNDIPPELALQVEAIHIVASPHVFALGRIVRICRILRKHRPHIVHTHLRSSNIVGTLCARLCGIPVVTTLHNTFPELGLQHARRDWAESWAMRLGAATVLAVGPAVAETHQPRLGTGRRRKTIEVLPNPVEQPVDDLGPTMRKARARATLGFADKEGTGALVLTVGRVTPAKGLDDAVEVISRLLVSVPNVRLAVVGDGPFLDALKSLVVERGLEERILLVGRSAQVREFMAAADVYLSMSLAEGLPLVLLEAMSMHLPIVATQVGDVAWLLEDGQCGHLVDTGDVGAAASKVGALLSSPALAGAMSARAHARACETFSVEGWLHNLDAIYRREAKRVTNTSSPVGEASSVADTSLEDEDDSRVSASRLQ